MNSSPLETVPTRAISSVPLTFWEFALIASTAVSTALAMPFFITTGLAPAARFFRPSRTMACARSVAVVVPSPATSLVLVETSRTSCAPMFSNGSSSSISLAMVTPSLVISGAPNFLSSTTLRPLGPRVTFTVSARTLTPASSALRASSPDLISLDIIFYLLDYSTIARMSLWRTTTYSSSSSLTSVPEYLLVMTLSPGLTVITTS